jgi:hypothetical protein
VMYAPAFIAAKRIDSVVSQIDVAPTIMGLLNRPYVSRFFGRDALKDDPLDARVFMANYQTVGYVAHGLGVILRPRQVFKVFGIDSGDAAQGPLADAERDKAIAAYQTAARQFSGRSPVPH